MKSHELKIISHEAAAAGECSCGKWAWSSSSDSHERLRAAFAEHATPFLEAEIRRLDEERQAAERRWREQSVPLKLHLAELQCPFVVGDIIETSDGTQGVVVGFVMDGSCAYPRWRRIVGKSKNRLHAAPQLIYIYGAFTYFRKVGRWPHPIE